MKNLKDIPSEEFEKLFKIAGLHFSLNYPYEEFKKIVEGVVLNSSDPSVYFLSIETGSPNISISFREGCCCSPVCTQGGSVEEAFEKLKQEFLKKEIRISENYKYTYTIKWNKKSGSFVIKEFSKEQNLEEDILLLY